MRVVIVGAGIAGLSVAWRLAQAGVSVEILERGFAGRGATWAAAGMLAPIAEFWDSDDPVAHFALAARAAWPDFATEIQAISGHGIGFRTDGSMTVAQNESRAVDLQKLASRLEAKGRNAVWLSASELRAKEGLLSPRLLGALYVPMDAQVDNRALGEVLTACLKGLNIASRERCDVRSLFLENGRVKGVVTSEGVIGVDAVVLATGAWMNEIGGPGVPLPRIKPIKGQMASLTVPSDVSPPQALIWDEDVYLVPRQGRLLVGATVEDVGFDTSVSKAAHDRLLAAARSIIPDLMRWSLSEIWTGLRPLAQDDVPLFGKTAVDGLYLAAGQFRNGILFAPLIAEHLKQAILGEKPEAAMDFFDPRRFSALD